MNLAGETTCLVAPIPTFADQIDAELHSLVLSPCYVSDISILGSILQDMVNS